MCERVAACPRKKSTRACSMHWAAQKRIQNSEQFRVGCAVPSSLALRRMGRRDGPRLYQNNLVEEDDEVVLRPGRAY